MLALEKSGGFLARSSIDPPPTFSLRHAPASPSRAPIRSLPPQQCPGLGENAKTCHNGQGRWSIVHEKS